MIHQLTRAELLKRYLAGDNIAALLRGVQNENSEEIIELAYDLQAGSYVDSLKEESVRLHKLRYANQIASTIKGLGEPQTVMEAGVGEATTLSFVLKQLCNVDSFGFDISWSRVSVAREWLQSNGVGERCRLFTSSIFKIPLPDNSIDIVYTSHSIEPNGGREEAAVRELYRVSGKYLVLLEPAFDLASAEAKARMKSHGYCIDLFPVIESLGYEVTRHELFPHTINSLNPTGITIIKKPNSHRNVPQLCCPVTRAELVDLGDALFSPQHLAAYPVLCGIPCLRQENAIVASRLASGGRD